MPLDSKSELAKIVHSTITLFKADNNIEVVEILERSKISSEMSHFDRWDGGQYYYTIYFEIPVDLFAKIQNDVSDIEPIIAEKIELVNRGSDSEHISKVVILPSKSSSINWDLVAGTSDKISLIKDIEFLKNTMISVSTGGQRIQEVNNKYQAAYRKVGGILNKLNLHNPNPYDDLWQWYGKWSSEINTYAERRAYIADLYSDLIATINESEENRIENVTIDLKGWDKIKRSVNEIKKQVAGASTEEQFQTIGLLCREMIISLAQEVYDKEKHPSVDGVDPSKTDANRMLEAYIRVTLGGSSNENLRRYAKSTLKLANELTHKRTAMKKDALLCSSASINLINLIRILEEN